MARKMKDSGVEWIGLVPEDWQSYRLKKCISSHDAGAWGDEPQDGECDYICIRVADFDYDRMTIKKNSNYEYTIRNYKLETVERLLLQKNDILIEKSGGGEKTPVGRTIIFSEEFPALYANFIERLRVNEMVVPKFMQYIFVTFYKNRYSINYIKQTTGIQNLDITSMLSEEKVVIPTKIEQQKIADFLDEKVGEIDTIISKTRESIEEYKKYKNTIIIETVTRGMNSKVEMKKVDLDFADTIPKHWEKTKISRLYEIHSGKNIVAENFIDNGNYKVFGGNGFRGYFNQFNTEGEHLLIGRQGALCGNIHLVNEKIWATDHALVCEEKTEFTFNPYFYYCFISMNFNQYSRSAAQPGISSGQIGLLYTCLPPVEEQQEIAEYLDAKCGEIDALIAKKGAFIAEMEDYKKSLIYEYVTGKKEVV